MTKIVQPTLRERSALLNAALPHAGPPSLARITVRAAVAIVSALVLGTLLQACTGSPKEPPPTAAARPAAAPPPPPRFTGRDLGDLIARPNYREAVSAVARQQQAGMPDACPAMAFTPTGRVFLLREVGFASDGRLLTGAWIEPVIGNGCDKTRQFNVMATTIQGSDIAFQPLLPGNSIADPATQAQAAPAAVQSAAAIVGTCPAPAIFDTRFDRYTGPSQSSSKVGLEQRPWTEVWMLWACDRPVDVPMQFTLDPTRGSILARAGTARLK